MLRYIVLNITQNRN